MKNFLLICISIILICSPIFSQRFYPESPKAKNNSVETNNSAKKFEFKYKEGDSYRILSKVNEDVFVNNDFNHRAEILNRITVNVTNTNTKTGSGTHEAVFMTSESSVNGARETFSYGEEYKSIFERDKRGTYKISDKYFMPVVRDVPIFPDKEILPGDTWTAKGHEAHDLRRTFGIETPYKVPFEAVYTYLGAVKENGKTFYKFDVQYNLYFKVDATGYELYELPIETSGFSHQTIFWDYEKGYIDHYNEVFKIVMRTTSNNFFRFEGTASAEVQDFVPTATEKNVQDVTEKISDLGLENVTVSAGTKGLTISIENIQFDADSDFLRDSEKKKLDKIAQILKEYSGNDLLITGHTALRGTEKSRKALSESRAQAVADYLIKTKVRDKYHIFTQGLGATMPLAQGDSPESLAKNRRVEITIMDK